MNKIKQVISDIVDLDPGLMQQAQRRLDNLTKPLGSLGRLEDLAKQIVGITGRLKPRLEDKIIFTLAADHGVVAEGTSAYPQEVTAQMVANFLSGGAGINVLAAGVGARVLVVDAGVASKLEINSGLKANFRVKKINLGTRNMAKGPAMTRQEAGRAIESGIELVETELSRGMDIVGTGEMGIGNSTAASAITAVYTQQPVEELTGRGTGIDDTGLKRKIAVIKKALQLNQPNPSDALDVLSKVGGFEIGGLAGVILGCSQKRIPVVIDGFISGAAALIACGLAPKSRQYLIASHCSAEPGHQAILKYLGLKALLDLNLRLGEGTGAALGIWLCQAAVKLLVEMATFEGAQVSRKIKA